MAISKVGSTYLSKLALSPLDVGFGAMSYGMGTSSIGGAAAGTAAQLAAGAGMKAALKPILRKVPMLKPLGWAADIYAAMKAYSIGDRIGNKVAPISWSKNRLPQAGE